MRRPIKPMPLRSHPGRIPIGHGCGFALVDALLVLAFLFLVFCVLFAAIQTFGFATTFIACWAALVILGLTVLWGLAYLRAPELTRNGTVLLIVGLLTLSVLPKRALTIRETARRQTSVNSLRRIGQVMQALQDTGRPVNVQEQLREYERTEGEAGETR